jgi:hypothetical protein
MATQQEIAKSIESHIRRKSFLQFFWGYENWYIGVTEFPDKRKQGHKHPEKWKAWKVSTASSARTIEEHFLMKGMKGGKGGGTNTVWVYVY